MSQIDRIEKFWKKMLVNFGGPNAIGGLTHCKADEGPDNRCSSLVVISDNLISDLKTYCTNHALDLESLLLAAWAVLIANYSDRDDVTIGVRITSGGETRDTALLPMRLTIGALATLPELAAITSSRRGEITENSAVSLVNLRNWANVPAELAFFESACVFAECDATGSVDYDDVPLILRAKSGESGDLTLDYNSERFDAEFINRLAQHFSTLLESALTNPGDAALSLPFMPQSEFRNTVDAWNDTEQDLPSHLCLHELFEIQVKKNPQATAVIFDEAEVSYEELDRRANQLAHYLISLGAGPEVLVGLSARRSVEMIIGILGILKAGAAYVPVDPNYPKNRMAFMFDDANVSILVAQTGTVDDVNVDARQVVLNDPDAPFLKESIDRPVTNVTSNNLGYVIYTSGSTGLPKGIALRHSGVVNNLLDLNCRAEVASGDKILCVSSLSFDMCVYETLGALAAGATIVMPDPAGINDPRHWAELIVKYQISVWNSAPALLEMLVAYTSGQPALFPDSIRVAILGGDWVPLTLPKLLRDVAGDVRVIVLGGATELSVHSTYFEVHDIDPAWKSIPYGKPMSNQTAYILDSRLQPVPIGVAGELHLGGAGLARGYLNRKELTDERFISSPFGSGDERIYKTGDLARFGSDGTIELLGRMDFQVKIRGHRIELGEIQTNLNRCRGVLDSVVTAKEIIPGEKTLIAYVVPDTEITDREDSGKDMIEQWQKIYDETYVQPSPRDDETLNDVGWTSSYTGDLITEAESREIVEGTVADFLSLGAKSVLELGCGTGMLSIRIAPHCDRYVASDLSSAVVERLRPQFAHLPQVELLHREADNFEGIEAHSFDAVIMNSVSQHFPDLEYFLRVVTGAMRAVKPGGYVFLGDMFNKALLESFHSSVQYFKAPESLEKRELKERIRHQLRHETQLFIDPQLLHNIAERCGRVSRLLVQLKRGSHHNEITRFRYNAILCLDRKFEGDGDDAGNSFEYDGRGIIAIREQIEDLQSPCLVVTDILNSRLFEESAIRDWFENSDDSSTVGQFGAALKTSKTDVALDPEAIRSLAEEYGLEVRINWPMSSAPFRYDASFSKTPQLNGNPLPSPAGEDDLTELPVETWRQFATEPLKSQLDNQLIPQLRKELGKQLPCYMVPTTFVLLDSFPLTPNGKLDRRALPVPEQSAAVASAEFALPENELEEVISGIWMEALGAKHIGTNDNFFELGGHSITATQIVSRLNELFGVKLPLSSIFDASTIAGHAAVLMDFGLQHDVEVQEIAQVLVEVSQLSSDQVEDMLADEGR